MPERKMRQLPIIPERVEAAVSRLADIVPEVCPAGLRDVLFESKQSSLGKAMLADLLDAVPVVGDIGNFYRVKHAARVGRERPRRVTRQMVDILVGIVPDPVGGVLDLLLPMNTVTYLQERGVLQR
jgi:hypothetical protein